MASDRIFGLIGLAISIFYIAASFQIQTSFLSDPVGPKSFPILVGTVAAICCAIIAFKPDPDPAWPKAKTFAALAIAVIALIAYSYMLKPLGFVIPTALVASLLSYQINPKKGHAIAAGICLSIGLYLVFKYALGLSLVGFGKPLLTTIGMGA